MNRDDNNNNQPMKTPSQDAQGRWYELVSPTQVLTGHKQATATVAPTAVAKRKQPRDRRLQRYWRKLRRQNVDERTIGKYKKRLNRQRHQPQQQEQIQDVEMEQVIPLNDTMEIINGLVHRETLPGPYNPQGKINKRKRDQSNQPDETVTKSLSQMCVTEKSTKKSKRSSSSMQIKQQHETEEMAENQENNIQSDIIEQTTSSSSSLHYYLKASKRKFKQMLRTAIVGEQNILEWCNTEEKLIYLYEHTRLLDKVYYLKLEKDLWENYIEYGETSHCWTSPLSKTIIQQHQLTSDYQQLKKPMVKYQQKLSQQLQEAEANVDQHTLLLKDYQHQDSMIDEQHLWATTLALVRKGQHKLSQNYEHRKRLFKNSAKDHYLVKTCYDCQPTEHEIQSMQIIWQATIDEYKSKEEVDILKQHVYVKRIPKSLDYLDESLKKTEKKLTKSVYNNNIRTTISSRHKKIIAQNKCDMMTLYISMAEAAVRGYHQYGEDEKKKLLDHMLQDPLRQSIAHEFIKAIEERQKYIQQHIEYLTKRRLHFFYHRSDDRRQIKWNRRSYQLNLYWDILPTSPIIEVYSKLTSEQLALLARGPKYVPPCQTRFYKEEKREQFIEQEYQSILNSIKNFIRQGNYCIADKRIDEFSIDLKQLLQRLYTEKLPQKLFVRAKREHKLIMRIRHYLREHPQVILRRTDKSKVFHLGDANDYHRKVLQYMKETEAYEEIISGSSPLASNLQQVITLLNRLYHIDKPLLTKKQYETMYPNEYEIELGHLYFIPKPHKIDTPLRPIVASLHAPAIKISIYLDDLLRPIFYRVAKQSTYMNDMLVVKQLEEYERNGHLLPTTKFITADVKNLYTMIPRAGAIDALFRFCTKYGKQGKIGNLAISAIIRLACVVLETNCFVYDKKYYKQIRGGAMGSPFTMTLANIYMYEWEQTLISYQQERNELYGRYIDDIFMTSNESPDTIKELLNREGKKDINIGINYSVHESAEFLDVFIENNQGQLRTSVYRKPAAEPYILPYTSDHPRHIHSNTIYTSLLRAIRLSSDVQTFDQERLNIAISFILNGYSPKFITYHITQFFRNHNALSIYKQLDNQTYIKLHQKLLDESTRDNENPQPSEQPQPSERPRPSEQPQTEKKNEKPQRKPRKLIIHHRFEGGPLTKFKQQFNRIWQKHFCYEGSTLNNVHLIIGTTSNPSLERLLVKKKPSHELLRKMNHPNETNNNIHPEATNTS